MFSFNVLTSQILKTDNEFKHRRRLRGSSGDEAPLHTQTNTTLLGAPREKQVQGAPKNIYRVLYTAKINYATPNGKHAARILIWGRPTNDKMLYEERRERRPQQNGTFQGGPGPMGSPPPV